MRRQMMSILIAAALLVPSLGLAKGTIATLGSTAYKLRQKVTREQIAADIMSRVAVPMYVRVMPLKASQIRINSDRAKNVKSMLGASYRQLTYQTTKTATLYFQCTGTCLTSSPVLKSESASARSTNLVSNTFKVTLGVK
jgi:hypothetical protein